MSLGDQEWGCPEATCVILLSPRSVFPPPQGESPGTEQTPVPLPSINRSPNAVNPAFRGQLCQHWRLLRHRDLGGSILQASQLAFLCGFGHLLSPLSTPAGWSPSSAAPRPSGLLSPQRRDLRPSPLSSPVSFSRNRSVCPPSALWPLPPCPMASSSWNTLASTGKLSTLSQDSVQVPPTLRSPAPEALTGCIQSLPLYLLSSPW